MHRFLNWIGNKNVSNCLCINPEKWFFLKVKCVDKGFLTLQISIKSYFLVIHITFEMDFFFSLGFLPNIVVQTFVTPYLPCISFNKPTCVAVKLSVIRIFFMFQLFIFVHCTYIMSKFDKYGPCFTFLINFWIAKTKCYIQIFPPHINISISSLTFFIIVSFLFLPSNSWKPWNNKNNFFKNTVLIVLHYSPIWL